jgi:hypothetical protein
MLCIRDWHPRILSLIRRALTDPAYGLFALFVGGVALAAVLDLEIGWLRHLGPVEEIVELNAALALLLAVQRTNRALRGRSGGAGGVRSSVAARPATAPARPPATEDRAV